MVDLIKLLYKLDIPEFETAMDSMKAMQKLSYKENM